MIEFPMPRCLWILISHNLYLTQLRFIPPLVYFIRPSPVTRGLNSVHVVLNLDLTTVHAGTTKTTKSTMKLKILKRYPRGKGREIGSRRPLCRSGNINHKLLVNGPATTDGVINPATAAGIDASNSTVIVVQSPLIEPILNSISVLETHPIPTNNTEMTSTHQETSMKHFGVNRQEQQSTSGSRPEGASEQVNPL